MHVNEILSYDKKPVGIKDVTFNKSSTSIDDNFFNLDIIISTVFYHEENRKQCVLVLIEPNLMSATLFYRPTQKFDNNGKNFLI